MGKRLFAAKGTGGIWLSDNLGDSWKLDRRQPAEPGRRRGRLVARRTAARSSPSAATPSYGSGGYTGLRRLLQHQPRRDLDEGERASRTARSASRSRSTRPTRSRSTRRTSFGLFRSTDGGKTYTNVNLPTGECAGVAGGGSCCLLANMVTDVAIAGAGRRELDRARRGTVVAASAGAPAPRTNADGTRAVAEQRPLPLDQRRAEHVRQARRLGLHAAGAHRPRSSSAPTTGPLQDHDYLYAIVQDAAALNGAARRRRRERRARPARRRGHRPERHLRLDRLRGDLDADGRRRTRSRRTRPRARRSSAPARRSATSPACRPGTTCGSRPTRRGRRAAGVPTRLAFGLEEVWQNELAGRRMDGPTKFKVIGRYFAGASCLMLNLGLPRRARRTASRRRQQHDAPRPARGALDPRRDRRRDARRRQRRRLLQAARRRRPASWTTAAGATANQTGFSHAAAVRRRRWRTTAPSGRACRTTASMKIDPRTASSSRRSAATARSPRSTRPTQHRLRGLRLRRHGASRPTAARPGATSSRRSRTPGSSTRSRWTRPTRTTSSRAATRSRRRSTAPRRPARRRHRSSAIRRRRHRDRVLRRPPVDEGLRPRHATATRATPDADAERDRPGQPGLGARHADGQATYVGFCGLCDILNANAPFNSGIATNVGGDKPREADDVRRLAHRRGARACPSGSSRRSRSTRPTQRRRRST